MSLAEKMTERIMDQIRLKTVMAFQGATNAGLTEAVEGIKQLVKASLISRIDINDDWLGFLNLPKYEKLVGVDGDNLFNAAAAGYEIGYLQGWQDRDGLMVKENNVSVIFMEQEKK